MTIKLAFLLHETHRSSTLWSVIDAYENEDHARQDKVKLEQENPDYRYKVTQIPFHTR